MAGESSTVTGNKTTDNILKYAAPAGFAIAKWAKPKKAVTDPYGSLNPEQRAVVQALGPNILESINSEPEAYGGQLTAEMSPEEAAYYNPTRAELLGGTIDTMLQEANDPIAARNAFQTEVYDPAMQTYRQDVLPGLMEDGGSAFSTYAANRRAQLLGTEHNRLSQLFYDYRQQAKDRALQAYNQIPQVQQYLSVPRVFRQAGLDRQYQEYIRQNESAQRNIDVALQFLGLSTGTYTPKDSSNLNMLMSAALGAAGIAAGAGMFGGGGGAAAGAGARTATTNQYGLTGAMGRSGNLAAKYGY